MNNQGDPIREGLAQRLGMYDLSDRIIFDDSAIEALRRLSGGDWRLAEEFAGTAVLDALQQGRNTVIGADLKGTTPYEAVRLMLGGRDIWDDVRYIGTQVPNMLPIGVQLRRALSLSSADRVSEALRAEEAGRLPQYALLDKVGYAPRGIWGSEVNIPFRFRPSGQEVQAVANSLAGFVSTYTGEPQELRDISGSSTQYFVQPQTADGRDPLWTRPNPNYRVNTIVTFELEDAQGLVSIIRESSCRHPADTLEAYVRSLK